MDYAASAGTIVAFAAALAAGGAISGFMAGLLGIGGGAILVLILYEILAFIGVDEAVRMHISVGSALGVIIPTSIRSFMAHRARGAVDEDLLKRWALPTIVGVGIGTLIAAAASGWELKAIFVFCAYLLALRMFFGKPSWVLGNEMPGQPMLSVYGIGIGIISVIMGIGGGVLTNTVMTLYGRPIHQAVATSAGLGVVISIPGAIGFVVAGWGDPHLPFASLGYVNLLAVALVIPITFVTAPLGVRCAHALSKRQLEVAFGCFLVMISTWFLSDLL